MSYSDRCKIKFLNINGADIPDEQYFKIPGISNSKLKLINPLEGGSPELYKQGFKHSYNTSLEMGTAVHTQLLQPEDFELSDYEDKPSGKCGYFIDLVYNYRQQGMPFYEAIEKASIKADYYVGKLTPKLLRKIIVSGYDYYMKKLRGEFNVPNKEVTVLPKRELNTAKECIKSVNNNFEIQTILRQGVFEEKDYYNEIALFTDIEVKFPNGETVIVPFKGKLDSVVIDNEKKRIYLNDLKTTSRQLDYFMDRVIDGEVYNGAFSHHHYYRQLAIYAIMLQMYCNMKLHKMDYSMECNIFAVETTGSHASRRFKINQAYIDAGLKEFKDLICRVAYHTKYGFDTIFPESND